MIKDTSWNKVAKWYDTKIKTGQSFFHTEVILPKLQSTLDFKAKDTVLDLACGQGVLTEIIPDTLLYDGIDLSVDLIEAAKQARLKNCEFYVGDVSKSLKILKENKYSKIFLILALQNIEDHEGVVLNISKHLDDLGEAHIVINHPYFRIPKMTGWYDDFDQRIQFRKIKGYMSAQKIPIDMTPGNSKSKHTNTWSFHLPLSSYINCFTKNNLYISEMQEWISPKTSEGKYARMENVARNEIPMFMYIKLKRVKS